MEWVGVVLVLVGFLGSLVNALWARRERIQAGRSADLALEVQESMAESQSAIAAALARPSVAFEIRPSGRRWLLVNTGQDKATGLRIDWPEFTGAVGEMPDAVEPGNGIMFGIGPRRFGGHREAALKVVCDQFPNGIYVTLPDPHPPR